MQNILQTINHQSCKPGNFDENNPEFDIFKNVEINNYPAEKIRFFKKIRVSTNSVIFNYFNIIKESCILNNYEKYSKGFSFFLKFIFPKFNFSKKRFLLITDEWSSNYFHWHIIALGRLLSLKEKGLIADSTLLLPKKYQQYKFALPSLEKFGITKKKIVFLRRKSNIKVAELAFTTCSLNNASIFKELRKILTKDVIKPTFDFGEKIYISRAGQVLRFVENEKEVVELLEKYGFKKIIIDQFSYDEQIAICTKIKYLVSPHGAGLTNILFMPENTSILEMASKPDPIKPVTDYCRLAAILNVKYFYQECDFGPNSQVKDFHHGSLIVDLEKLEKNLKLML